MDEGDALGRLSRDVDGLADWRREVDKERAVEAVRMAEIDKSIDRLRVEVHSMRSEANDSQRWLIRLVAAAVVLQAASWIMDGGLKIGGGG